MSISNYLTTKVDEELYDKVFDAVLFAIMDGVTNETPMNEIRKKVNLAGTYAGRVFGALYHQGPVNGNMLMNIRNREEEMKRVFNGRVIGAFRPGGELLGELNNLVKR